MKFVKQVLLSVVVLTFGSMGQDVCQGFCNNVVSCITEEHEHGSYCKSWQDPPVCFGLYWTDESQTAMCFEPSEDGACSENIPVTC